MTQTPMPYHVGYHGRPTGDGRVIRRIEYPATCTIVVPSNGQLTVIGSASNFRCELGDAIWADVTWHALGEPKDFDKLWCLVPELRVKDTDYDGPLAYLDGVVTSLTLLPQSQWPWHERCSLCGRAVEGLRRDALDVALPTCPDCATAAAARVAQDPNAVGLEWVAQSIEACFIQAPDSRTLEGMSLEQLQDLKANLTAESTAATGVPGAKPDPTARLRVIGIREPAKRGHGMGGWQDFKRWTEAIRFHHQVATDLARERDELLDLIARMVDVSDPTGHTRVRAERYAIELLLRRAIDADRGDD